MQVDILKEKNGIKYLIFDDSVNENKELLKNYADVWDGIKDKIKAINGGKENEYRKDYMKIKLNFDDDLPLNKPLKFYAMTIIIRSVFEEGGKLYPQVFSDDAWYELLRMEINIIQMNFKNRPNYLFNDNLIVDINDFDSSQLEINYHLRVF